MAKYGFTLHSIVRGGSELPLSTVQEFNDNDYSDMLRLGAIRPATSDEMILAGLSTATSEPSLFDAKPSKSRKAKKDDEPATDPEVEDPIL